jgi:hypothetical protein
MTEAHPKPFTVYLVLYEWHGCHELSDDRTWHPSVEIIYSKDSALDMINRYRRLATHRMLMSYRNVRGPYEWSEPIPAPVELPCAHCQFRWAAPGGQGHCYMFETIPSGDFCGQFKPGVGFKP